ncbi:flavodoxin family protein [bacterium]|nr:flavodoxin family protein [bacterium]
MDKLLIIYSHPNHDGHNGYFLKKFIKLLENNAIKNYEIIDLYKINYYPILKENELYSMGHKDISKRNIKIQEKIKKSDKLLFIYPTWWQNMPAILKGFIDRIFVSGFAFKYENGLPKKLLKNKKAVIFTSTGGPKIYNNLINRKISIKILSKHVLNFSGIKSKGFILSSANNLNEKKKEEIKKIALKSFKYLYEKINN